MVRTQGLEEATHALPHGSVSEAVKLVTEDRCLSTDVCLQIQRTDVCLHATLTGTSSATQLAGVRFLQARRLPSFHQALIQR